MTLSLRPVSRHGVVSVPGYITWCGSMTRTMDGKCHLYLSIWEEKWGFEGWVTHSKAGYASADDPDGPYTFHGVTLDGTHKDGDWDRDVIHNPWILQHGGRFYLYYVGNWGDGEYWDHQKRQRVGVAVSDNPGGPWTRLDTPMLPSRPGLFDAGITSNPTVCALPDGRFMMIYKGSAPHPAYKNGVVSHGAAFADSPVGPWTRRDKPIFSVEGARFSAEDPCLFYWNGALHCVMKDMGRYYCPDEERALVHFTSRDLGESWQKAEPFVFSTRRVPFDEGGEREIARLERPFVYQEDGAPAMFFAAAKPDADRDAAYNVHRRIAVSE